jgi:hypothetical protein
MLKKTIAAFAALSMTATPLLAQASAPATAGIVSPEPAAETVQGSELRRGYLLPLLGLTAAILALLALTDKWPFDGKDKGTLPTSP